MSCRQVLTWGSRSLGCMQQQRHSAMGLHVGRADHSGAHGTSGSRTEPLSRHGALGKEAVLSPVQLREMHRSRAAVHSFSLKGVSFDGRQGALAQVQNGDAVMLVREPDNEYDSHAIAVKRLNGQQLGYVPRDINLSPVFSRPIEFGHIRSVGVGAFSGFYGAKVDHQPSLPPLTAEAVPRQLQKAASSVSAALERAFPPSSWCQITGSMAEPPQASSVWQADNKQRKLVLAEVTYLAPQLWQAQAKLLQDGPIDREAALIFQSMNGWTFDEVVNYREQQQSVIQQRSLETWGLDLTFLNESGRAPLRLILGWKSIRDLVRKATDNAATRRRCFGEASLGRWSVIVEVVSVVEDTDEPRSSELRGYKQQTIGWPLTESGSLVELLGAENSTPGVPSEGPTKTSEKSRHCQVPEDDALGSLRLSGRWVEDSMSLRERRRKRAAVMRRDLAYTALTSCLLLLAGSAAGADGPKDFRQKFKVSLEDVVVSMPVDQKHLTVARGSRAWRKGMRTVIAGQSEPTQAQVEEGRVFNETWTWYPDDMPLRSLYGGDSRAALVPFIAHRQLGDSYKWLLYGDDDTVWFMDGVLRFLEDLDPDMPYFISDHLWWSSAPGRASHPHPAAPRCLPCNYPDAYMDKMKAPFRAPKGCPCTPQLLCSTDERGIFNQFCDIPRAPVSTFSMHGGAGGIMSIGLMRAVSFDFMEMCVKSLYSTGGDAFISICMWQAGFAVTDPGYSFYHPEIQMMDPGPEDRLGIMMKLARALDANRCDERCRNMLDHMLSIHVRSRVFATLEDAAQFIKSVSMLYDAYVETKNINKLKSALKLTSMEEQTAAVKEADQVAGATAAHLASRQAQEQAVKQAEQQAAKEVEAAREAASVGIHAAAATSGSARPDHQDVEKLVLQVQSVDSSAQGTLQ